MLPGLSCTVKDKEKRSYKSRCIRKSLEGNTCEFLPPLKTRKACVSNVSFYKVYSEKYVVVALFGCFLSVQILIINSFFSLSGKIIKRRLCLQYLQLQVQVEVQIIACNFLQFCIVLPLSDTSYVMWHRLRITFHRYNGICLYSNI